ncbi:MAG: hypothetical protein R3B07_04540 [Polyangiaceae bacterium]
MRHLGYVIADEPTPGRLERFAVNPVFPLLATMMTTTLFGMGWFVLNSFALGSTRKAREFAYVAAGVLGYAALIAGFATLHWKGIISDATEYYCVQLVLAWKLLFAYWLQESQSLSFEIFQHYGGKPARGFMALIAAFVLRMFVRDWIPDEWLMVLA